MKAKLSRLSQRYVTALARHLKRGPQASLQAARGLGCQAVAIGLETLDLARIHEGALATLEAAGSSDGVTKRADIFFTEAIIPIEQTHRAAVKTNARLGRLSQTLGRRTGDLAGANRLLKQGIAQRKAVEHGLQKSAAHHARLLKESRQLQAHLQRLTHRILSAHEAERKKVSRELHDEVAQTLLGINVRLLTLKKGATVNAAGLKKEIASTQQLVEESVRIMNRCSHEFGKHHAK
jgi:signal transduction histidine kinase